MSEEGREEEQRRGGRESESARAREREREREKERERERERERDFALSLCQRRSAQHANDVVCRANLRQVCV